MNQWEPLQFLIGSWSSPVSGQPGEGISGSTTFSYELDRKVMLRKSRAEFSPTPDRPAGLVHEDLLVIYQQPGEPLLRAIYFDNEGHIIHYVVTARDGRPAARLPVTGKSVIVFESEAGANSPRARLVYEAAEDGTLSVEFSVAAPGGELVSHVKGVLQRDG